MKRIPLGVSLALIVLANPAFAASQLECRKLDERQVVALFQEWNSRLQTGQAEKVADLYTDQALLLPTLSGTARKDRAAHIDYFNRFLRDRPAGTLNETHVYGGCDQASLAGLYTFTFAATGQQQAARFTFNYRYVDGQWLIAHHHSSIQPAN